MAYLSYLMCVVLVLPAIALCATEFVSLRTGASGLSALGTVLDILFYFLPGLDDPTKEGWRIAVWLAGVAVLLGSGAIRRIRILVFYALGILGTVGIAACLYSASREGFGAMLFVTAVLSPSIAGVAASMWFTVKYESTLTQPPPTPSSSR